ncbi:hypothetical protein TrVFT333_001637 [Trichoderma virens FT-333]|nr:hypothetical protein TrVFT333_001637 [Trichoderma virens FT-333]
MHGVTHHPAAVVRDPWMRSKIPEQTIADPSVLGRIIRLLAPNNDGHTHLWGCCQLPSLVSMRDKTREPRLMATASSAGIEASKGRCNKGHHKAASFGPSELKGDGAAATPAEKHSSRLCTQKKR